MTNIEKMNSVLEKFVSIREEERKQNIVGTFTPDVNDCNFLPMNDNRSICALDDIIERARCVYGPYGGIYGEVYASQHVEGQPDDLSFSKSKDGHNYLMGIRYDSTVDDVLLIMIKQYTNYIASYRNKETSKDGTTSLALLASQLAKNVLMRRVINPNIMSVPTTVENWIFDLIHEETAKVIEKYRIKTYNETTREYEELGYENCLNAIKTTVDNNSIMMKAFNDLMKTCSDQKLNIPAANIMAPVLKSGNPDLYFNVEAGIKMRAFPIDEDKLAAFNQNKSLTLILEGGISPEHRNLFEKVFTEWITHLINTKDETGEAIFGSYHKDRLHAPVFLCTTPNDTLKDIFNKIRINGVRIQHGNGRNPEVIRPIFMQLYASEDWRERYNDIKYVMDSAVIDLGLLDKYYVTKLMEQEHKYYDENGNPTPLIKPEKFKAVNPLIFPVFDKDNFVIHTPLEMVGGLWDIYRREENYYKGIKVEIAKDAKTISIPELICTTNFNGAEFYCTVHTDEQKEKMFTRRKEIEELIDKTSKALGENDMAKLRLENFSGLTITANICYRTLDEAMLLQTLYEDAIGVFASVHVYGVMPGGNIGLLKLENNIIQNVKHRFIEEFLFKLNLPRQHRYEIYIDQLLDSIFDAYREIFILLFESREKGIKVLKELYEIFSKTNYLSEEEFKKAYDVVREKYAVGVFEAAQTTIDNFFGALSFTKDLLQLKTIKLKSGHYPNQAIYRITDGGPLHIRNKELIKHGSSEQEIVK